MQETNRPDSRFILFVGMLSEKQQRRADDSIAPVLLGGQEPGLVSIKRKWHRVAVFPLAVHSTISLAEAALPATPFRLD
jgi:hypothetical protein